MHAADRSTSWDADIPHADEGLRRNVNGTSGFAAGRAGGMALGCCHRCGETELVVDACRNVSISLLRGVVVSVEDLDWNDATPAVLFCPACGAETALGASEVGRLTGGGPA
jgi:hypothetical protein